VTREDLLALNEAVLVTLATKGLVARAGRMVASVHVSVADDGTVTGTTDDATVTVPPGGLDQARCTCPAPGVCRHLVATVLAYQATHEGGPAPQVWDPAQFTDTQLTDLLGARLVTSARTMAAGGLAATVHRGMSPWVELPTASVRFLVPHDLAYAVSDATDPRLVALAVWACRAAADQDPSADQVRVEVRPAGTSAAGYPQVVEQLDRLLATGVMNLGTGFGFAALRRGLVGLQWPADGLDDLVEQLQAYQQRQAVHDELRTADVLAELYGRHRAVTSCAPVIVPDVLGTEVAASTACARLRLVGLGARVRAVPSGESVAFDAQVYLADAASGVVLVLPHQWVGTAETVPALRRVATTTLGALAMSNVLTQSAHRSARRVLRLARSRIAPTSVLPLGDAWASLPAILVVADYAAAAERLAALPPRYVRPRVAAENLRVLAVAEVRDVVYHPGDQRLTAQVLDTHGSTAHVVCDYNPASPGGLDAAARLLADPGLRWVAGHVTRRERRLLVRPTALWSASGAVALDVATDDLRVDLDLGAPPPGDLIDEAIAAGLAALAALAHRGLAAPGRAALDRVSEASDLLTTCGLPIMGTTVAHAPTSPTAWVDAMVWLTVAAESR